MHCSVSRVLLHMQHLHHQAGQLPLLFSEALALPLHAGKPAAARRARQLHATQAQQRTATAQQLACSRPSACGAPALATHHSAVLHDTEDLRLAPATSEAIKAVCQPVFMEAACRRSSGGLLSEACCAPAAACRAVCSAARAVLCELLCARLCAALSTALHTVLYACCVCAPVDGQGCALGILAARCGLPPEQHGILDGAVQRGSGTAATMTPGMRGYTKQ